MPDFNPVAGQQLTADFLQKAAKNESYTPTLTGSVSDPALGAGGTITMNVHLNGSWAFCELAIVLGTGGGGGSGFYIVSTPYTIVMGGVPALGVVNCWDNSAPASRTAAVRYNGPTSVAFLMTADDQQVSNTVPWTWAVGDRIEGIFCFRT